MKRLQTHYLLQNERARMNGCRKSSGFRERLVLAGSSQNSTGFEGVYASAGGFGAKLQRGAKRFRQDGFRSPVEAALARARWTKSLDEGKGRPSATAAGASSGQQEQLAAEALADLATVEGESVAQPVVSANTEAAHKDRRWLVVVYR